MQRLFLLIFSCIITTSTYPLDSIATEKYPGFIAYEGFIADEEDDEELDLTLDELNFDSILENKSLNFLNCFLLEVEKSENFINLDKFLEMLKELGSDRLWYSMKVKEKIQEIGDIIFYKFKDKILLEGVYLRNMGLHIIYFEKENYSDKNFILRYKLSSSLSRDIATNAYLVFLNKKGFEVFRHFLGNVRLENLTGKLHISRNDYIEFRFIKIVSDQDTGLPVPCNFPLPLTQSFFGL